MVAWRAIVGGGAALASIGASAPLTPPPPITDVRAITLHGGINRIPGFLPGGGTATIVQAWRENGNAHGHYVWMVMGGPGLGKSDGLVMFGGSADDPSTGDTIGASPFDGERVTADVRFATARIAGKPVSLAIKGMLDEAKSGITADHATATIRWYRLVHHDNEIGVTPDMFEVIGTLRTTKLYCNVDLALRDAAGVALPHDFAGANRTDGCFAGG